MTSIVIALMLYVIDILHYIINDASWGFGIVKWENFLFHGYSATAWQYS
jgi:hypothetical protein